MTPAIKIKNLSKNFILPHERRQNFKDHFVNFFRPIKYEKFEALKNISFEANKGEWLGIIGPNGSGKSTLLKIIAGIYQEDAGVIDVDGRIFPFLELGAGFNPDLTARENIYLNGVILGMTKKEIKNKFNAIVNFAEIKEFLDQKLKNLSSGMKLRLAFSIAIQVEADIYLLDEILAVGDYTFQHKSLESLKKNMQNKSVILVSHDLDGVQEKCHRVIWLEKGEIKLEGGSQEVISAYIQKNK